MITILIDHNLEGQSALLWRTLVADGWLALIPIRMVTFADINLPITINDRGMWRFAQSNQMIILTANRKSSDLDALEKVIQEENTLGSLPVLTISAADRVKDRDYRRRCATRLMEIVLDLQVYKGVGRIYIP